MRHQYTFWSSLYVSGAHNEPIIGNGTYAKWLYALIHILHTADKQLLANVFYLSMAAPSLSMQIAFKNSLNLSS